MGLSEGDRDIKGISFQCGLLAVSTSVTFIPARQLKKSKTQELSPLHRSSVHDALSVSFCGKGKQPPVLFTT